MSNPTATPLANLQRSATNANKRIAEVKKAAALAVEAAQVNLATVNAELDKHINPPTATAADAAIAQEIRNHVKGIKDHEAREQFMRQAFATGELATVRAVVGAPYYLSGTVPQTHERWRGEFLTAAAPGLVAAHNNIEKGMRLAQEGARSLERHSREVIDFAKASDLDALAKELEGAA